MVRGRIIRVELNRPPKFFLSIEKIPFIGGQEHRLRVMGFSQIRVNLYAFAAAALIVALTSGLDVSE